MERYEAIKKMKHRIKVSASQQHNDKKTLSMDHSKLGVNSSGFPIEASSLQFGVHKRAIQITAMLNLYHDLRGKSKKTLEGSSHHTVAREKGWDYDRYMRELEKEFVVKEVVAQEIL